MISFAQVDNYKSSEKSAPENDETEPKAKDFATLLNVPIENPNAQALNSAAANNDADSEENTPDIASIEATAKTIVPENFLAKNITGQNFQTDTQPASAEKSINFKTLFDGEQAIPQSEVLAAQAETIKEGLESGKVEILKTDEPSKELPNVFGEVPSVLKNESGAKAKQSSSLFDLAIENSFDDSSKIIEQSSSKTANNGSALNLNQPEIEAPKAEKSFNAPEDFSAISFNKILESTSKENKVADAAAQTPVTPSDVYEQIEPKVLELITLNRVENEKKVMKMRLHPAELGTVEIRLERDASGKLTAHFQTESEATQKVLNQSLDQLRESLQNSGYQIERLEISCSPFSASGQDAGGQNPRQYETVENQLNSKAASDGNLEKQDDLKSNDSNRLLSVRA